MEASCCSSPSAWDLAEPKEIDRVLTTGLRRRSAGERSPGSMLAIVRFRSKPSSDHRRILNCRLSGLSATVLGAAGVTAKFAIRQDGVRLRAAATAFRSRIHRGIAVGDAQILVDTVTNFASWSSEVEAGRVQLVRLALRLAAHLRAGSRLSNICHVERCQFLLTARR